LRTISIAALVALAGCSPGPGSDWPRWRGPDGNAVSPESPLPVTWSASANVAWKIAVPGEGSSSPIVSGDCVFVTSALDDGTRRVLHCFDRRTGDVRWRRETKDGNPERTSALTGHAASTPAADGTRVVAVFGNAGVVCAGLGGELLWHRPLGEFDSELGLASSPILHKGLVFVVGDHDGDRATSFDSFLVALDAETGQTVWRTERPGLFRSWSTPIVVADRGREALIVCAQDEVRAYDPGTGRPLWSVPDLTSWVTPSPVFGRGLIVAVSGKNGPMVALRPDGTVAWREPRGGPYVCSPLLYGDHVYVHDEQGILVCRDAADGSLLYKARLTGRFTASPVAGDGKLYLTNEEGTTYVVRAGRDFEILSENRLGEETLASPAISRGSIFLRTRRHLFRFGNIPDGR
jgi:outer membrane protein assembly factor BamB